MENESLLRCRQLVEDSLQWGESAQWTRQDFANLSDRIYEKTHVRLSVSTLKRIWGKVRYESSPTTATLNALAQFVGYENWRSFSHQQQLTNEWPEVSVHATSPGKPKNNFVRTMSMAAIVVAGVVLIFLLVKGKTPVNVPDNVFFKAHKVSDELPNSVVFTYDASGFNIDSVTIQQNWDPKRRERVSAKNKKHTSIYYTPGYFAAKLIVNDEIVKEDIVFIKTQGWAGIIDSKPPIYIGKEEMNLPDGMGITAGVMKEKTGLSVFNERMVTFSNVRDFIDLHGNDFTLDIKLKNTATVEQSPCRKSIVTILSKGGAIVVPVSSRGCISEIGILTPDEWLSGKDHDFSALGCDYKDFEHLVCQVENNHFKITLNGKTVLDNVNKYSLADIIGLRIGFEGAGVIQEVKLSGKGKVYLDEKF
jgi:hypothetical protein